MGTTACPKCGFAKNTAVDRRCRACGVPLAAAPPKEQPVPAAAGEGVCSKCGRRVVGRATCSFCGAAVTPTAGAPAAAPETKSLGKAPPAAKHYEIGDLVEISIAPGDTGSGPLRVRYRGGRIVWPRECACCSGPADTTRRLEANHEVSHKDFMSSVRHVEKRSWSFEVPYCAFCVAHQLQAAALFGSPQTKPGCDAKGPAVAMQMVDFDKRILELTFQNRDFGEAVVKDTGGKVPG